MSFCRHCPLHCLGQWVAGGKTQGMQSLTQGPSTLTLQDKWFRPQKETPPSVRCSHTRLARGKDDWNNPLHRNKKTQAKPSTLPFEPRKSLKDRAQCSSSSPRRLTFHLTFSVCPLWKQRGYRCEMGPPIFFFFFLPPWFLHPPSLTSLWYDSNAECDYMWCIKSLQLFRASHQEGTSHPRSDIDARWDAGSILLKSQSSRRGGWRKQSVLAGHQLLLAELSEHFGPNICN